MSAEAQRLSSEAVSVVIPVMDNANVIGEAIESALGQTQPPGEVLVIDDGSADGSGAVAEAFGSPVRVVRQENQGIGLARNRGIRESSGQAIALLDADDRWLPDKLERQLAALTSEIDLVFGWVAQVPEARWEQAVRDGAPRETWMPGPVASVVLVRRSTFDRIGLFGDYRAGEFIDWFARFQAGGLQSARVDDVLVLRRIHAANHGIRQQSVYAENYLAVARAALARRSRGSSDGGPTG